MPVQLAERVKRVKPSPTVALTGRVARLKAEGHDIIGLGIGEPDFDTPTHIADAGVDAIRNGFTRYTAVEGIPELKDAIIAKFKRDNGIAYTRPQILVSTGAKQTIYNLFMAVIDPGDEVVIPAPYWVSYPDMALLADGVPVMPYAGPDQGYKITAAQLEAAITPKTRVFMLNSPSNPTGAAYTRAELEALGEVLRKHPRVDHRHRRHVRAHLLGAGAVLQLPDRLPRPLRPHGDDQRRVEELRDDRLAHRLLRRPGRDRDRDVDDPEPEHLEPERRSRRRRPPRR